MSDTINNEMTENQKTDDKVETADSAQSVPAVEPEKIAEAATPAPAADKPARTESREPSRERTERPRGRRGFYDSSERGDKESGPSDQGPRMPRFKKKICIFCQDRNMAADYKRPDILERFITDRGKILPRRVTGTCSKHQRHVAREIKRARTIALLPFVEQ
jgi:small subunit ribosomal protein S18